MSFPKVTVKGLPAGLKFDSKRLRIYGTATKPGVYTVEVIASNSTSKETVHGSFILSVPNFRCEALPGLKNAMDAYDVLSCGNIVVGKNGKITGKILDGGLTWSVSAPSLTSWDGVDYIASIHGKAGRSEFMDEVVFSSGVAQAAVWAAWRNGWKEVPLKNEASALSRRPAQVAVLNDGLTVSLKIGASGAVTAKATLGKLSSSHHSNISPTRLAGLFAPAM